MQHTTAALLLALLLLIFLARVLARRDFSRKSNADLLKLLALAGQRLTAAGTDRDRYDAALASTGRLMCEMKKRGMFAEREFAPIDLLQIALERLAQERFARSIEMIQELAARGHAAALYQMAVLFRAAREPDTARRYLELSAQAGHAEGQFALALSIFSAEDELTPQRQQRALSLLTLAARQGHAQAERGLEGVLKSLSTVSISSLPESKAARTGAANAQPAPAGSASLGAEPGSRPLPAPAWQFDEGRAQVAGRSGWRAALKPQGGRGTSDDLQVEHDVALFPFQHSRLT